MKKNLGLIIALAGILVVLYSLFFTPNHSFNPVDSNSGLDASAPLFFSAIIVFGVGVVIYANAAAAEKREA
ncbi:hypothetical protein [Mucilaginibacter boryungensis]|uniref:Uncharacterized protein n=1 Tax=Mucilaginibacter boryungensis TaxID=768480 RepID=A0ABR9XJB0_9SPHI|nr:hypothetical protein [Mucilaginibacter boryungensis]MBE9667351.1 hypothetical protein [Mucilaginibacter boryungensis]